MTDRAGITGREVVQAAELSKLIDNLTHREFRRKSGLFFVEGAKLVIAALRFGFVAESTVFCRDLMTQETSALLGRIRTSRTCQFPRRVYELLTKEYTLKQGADGIGVVFSQKWHQLADLTPGSWGIVDRKSTRLNSSH